MALRLSSTSSIEVNPAVHSPIWDDLVLGRLKGLVRPGHEGTVISSTNGELVGSKPSKLLDSGWTTMTILRMAQMASAIHFRLASR